MVQKFEQLFLIVFATTYLLIKSSSSSPIQNEILEDLKAELKSLRVKVDLLEVKNAANEAKIDLQEAKNVEQEKEIAQLKVKINGPLGPERLPALSNGYSTDSKIALINGKESPSRNIVTKALLPTSCRDLSQLGHVLDGLYLVRNPDTNKIETVFCNFGTSLSQDFIGNIDVKTKNVHFYVQRNSSFQMGGIIPFDLIRLNEGNAMNLASGIFTAPVPGIYHFQLSAVKYGGFATFLDVHLQINGQSIGRADTDQPAMNLDTISMSASLRLAANDRVNLYNFYNGGLYDDSSHFTHFTGWLIEEDLLM